MFTNANTGVSSKFMTDLNYKEIGISAIRSAFSAVPFAGQLLNEVAFEYRGRIKQNRLNKFTELLTDFFSQNQAIDLENLKTEDFSDLLESVLQRVVRTKSVEKMNRFKDILITKIQNPNIETDNAEIYLDLVYSLNEDEINILNNHQVFDKHFDKDKETLDGLEHDLLLSKDSLEQEAKTKEKGYVNNYDRVAQDIQELQQTINDRKLKLKALQQFREPKFYALTSDQFLYYKQSLYSKGLLIDSGIGAIGVRPFQVMSITEFGKEFISFVIRQ